VADVECTNCDNGCPLESAPFRDGLNCDQVFWIGTFRSNINRHIARVEKPELFDELIIRDLAYFLGTDTDHIKIWQLKPDGDKSVVYFKYLFDTDDDDEAQSTGGDVMILATEELKDDTSTAYRGFLMQYTDSAYPYTFMTCY